MPMSFPNMQSLKNAAEVWKFRQPHEGEEEAAFRVALADFVHSRDRVESMEIRTGKGWDQFNDAEAREMIFRGLRDG